MNDEPLKISDGDLIVLTDADNTLWNTDGVYKQAQLGVLEGVEALIEASVTATDRLSFVRSFDQALARQHHAHLRYPASLLPIALAKGLRSCAPEKAAADAIAGRGHELRIEDLETLVERYTSALRQLPELLPTVREGLEHVRAQNISIYMLTEGRIEKQRQIAAAHGIELSFRGIWEVTKSVEQFHRLKQRFDPGIVIVVGDQQDRDIAPARAAGCITLLIPGAFKPVWNESASEAADHLAADFLSAMKWAAKQGTSLDPIRANHLPTLNR